MPQGCRSTELSAVDLTSLAAEPEGPCTDPMTACSQHTSAKLACSLRCQGGSPQLRALSSGFRCTGVTGTWRRTFAAGVEAGAACHLAEHEPGALGCGVDHAERPGLQAGGPALVL